MARQTNTRLREKVIYSVFVRNHTKEGTFQALEGDLDRLAALGTDIIWLMPIHPIGEVGRKGTLGSPYAIRDFRGINPEYGTLGDFMHLVGEIHKRGMKCIIDVVYNHTSPDSILATGHPEFFLRDEAGNPTRKVADWSDAGYYCAADTELYDAFDITYDYDIWPYFEGCFQPTGTLREYTALVNFQESEYPAGYVKLRCLENHDQPRFASRVDSDEALRNWLALLYFEKGTTLLYSGQEYAPRHRVDLFNADDAYCDMRLDLQPYLKQLRQMKRTLPMSACFQLEAVEERAVVGRYDGPEARVRGIFDLKNAGGSVAVDLPDGTYTDRITGQEVTVSGGAFDLAQAPAVIG